MSCLSIVCLLVCVVAVSMAQPANVLEAPPAPEERFLQPGLQSQYWGLQPAVYQQRFGFCQQNCGLFLQSCGHICMPSPFGINCRQCQVPGIQVPMFQTCNTCIYYNSVNTPWAPVVPAQPIWQQGAFIQG